MPKISQVHLVVLVEHRLVTDRQTLTQCYNGEKEMTMRARLTPRDVGLRRGLQRSSESRRYVYGQLPPLTSDIYHLT